MEHIAQQAGVTHTDVAQGLQIPKSSLTALLQDMMSKGYLQRNADTGVFTIGVQVLWLANSYLRNLNLVRLGQPVVASVFSKVQEFTLLAIPTAHEYVVVCTESVPSILAHSLQMGQRGPMFCSAVGRAMLAFMPDAQVDAILAQSDLKALTPSTKTDIADIRKELARTRRTGIGVSKNEVTAGVSGYAVPVFKTGVPVASIGVGFATAQSTPMKVKNRSKRMLLPAETLSGSGATPAQLRSEAPVRRGVGRAKWGACPRRYMRTVRVNSMTMQPSCV